MLKNFFRKHDKTIAILFAIATLLLLIIAFTNKDFLDWAFQRHHNILSWYIRPVFLIPFCYFAYKQSWAGIAGTIFCLLTSMFWFSAPTVVSDQVKEFLEFEVDYLTGDWGWGKIVITLLIPISFMALGMAFWKRNVWIGLLVVIFMAVGKMIRSVGFAGKVGKSIFVPAMIGLLLCIALIYWGFKRLEKKT